MNGAHNGSLDGKIIFPDLKARLGTVAAFDEMQDEDHHMGSTLLLLLLTEVWGCFLR